MGMARTNRRNLEASPPVVGEVNSVKEFRFAMGIRRLARLISGNRGGPQGMEGRRQVLTSCDVTSLVIELV